MSSVIKVENLSKQYRLGMVGTGSLAHDLNRWWHRVRGNEDPYLRIGEENDRTAKGNSDYVWALKDINFEVQQGEVLGIIGRNGAGKSTLLKILSKTTSPTGGKIKIKGRIASLLEVGTGFHPELSGRDNIYLNGAILGMTRNEIKRKFDEIVDFAGVERYIDTPVKRYSSGMYVRLAFGVAAHLEPEILIVDEVLAVGDAEFQKKALGKMKDVSGKQGRTVLFVSHNMAAMLNICKHGMLLDAGRISSIGDIESVVSGYNSLNSIRTNLAADPKRLDRAMPIFRLTDFRITNLPKGGMAIRAIDNVQLELIIEGEFFEKRAEFNLGYSLKNELGETLIISYCTDQPTTQWLDFGVGKKMITALIDTSFLCEGEYQVYLLSSLHCQQMLFTEADEIKCSFEIIGNRGNSPYWINKRQSLIAPYVKWQQY